MRLKTLNLIQKMGHIDGHLLMADHRSSSPGKVAVMQIFKIAFISRLRCVGPGRPTPRLIHRLVYGNAIVPLDYQVGCLRLGQGVQISIKQRDIQPPTTELRPFMLPPTIDHGVENSVGVCLKLNVSAPEGSHSLAAGAFTGDRTWPCSQASSKCVLTPALG